MQNREIINALTKIDEKDNSTIVHSVKQGIEQSKMDMCDDVFHLGAYLLAAKAFRVWQSDGSEAKNFNHWMENEIGLKKSTGNNIMGVVKELYPVISRHLELSGIFPYRLIEILPYARGKTDEEKEELLHMAKTNSCRNLSDNLSKKPKDTCEHETETWMMNKCKKCGLTTSMTLVTDMKKAKEKKK